jgi:hypothetical protein
MKYCIIFLLIIPIVACVTQARIGGDNYYRSLAKEAISINEINDDATYHEIKMYENINHEIFEYKGMDKEGGWKLYYKKSKDEIFNVVNVYTDEKDIVVGIWMIKYFPLGKTYESNLFFNNLIITLRGKYVKLRPSFKDVDYVYYVSFYNKEKYEQEFIKDKKDPLLGIESFRPWVGIDRVMIHPILSSIEIIKISNKEFIGVTLQYKTNRFHEIYKATEKEKKKELNQKLKGF